MRPATFQPRSPRASIGGDTPPRLADVLPAPVRVEPAAGVEFILTPGTTIRTTAGPEAAAVGRYLADLLRRPTGYPLPIVPAGPADAPGGISLLLTGTGQGPAGERRARDGDERRERRPIGVGETGRREQTAPVRHLDIEPALANGGNLDTGQSRGRRDCQRAQAAGGDVRRELAVAANPCSHVPADQCRHGFAAAGERHVIDPPRIDAGSLGH